MQSAETARIAAQRAALGESGLAEKAAALAAASEANNKPIPDELLSAVPVPDIARVPIIPVTMCAPLGFARCSSVVPSSILDGKVVDGAVDVLPAEECAKLTTVGVPLQVQHVATEFVSLVAYVVRETKIKKKILTSQINFFMQ